MPSFPYFSRVIQDFVAPVNEFDWSEWRYCYYGGKQFRDKYLVPFSDRETAEEFARRKSLTPIPTYAKKEINRVRNTLASRLPDVIRKGGNVQWRSAIDGKGRGVDLRGASMNGFTSKLTIPEMLVMQQFGVYVDAPSGNFARKSDVPKDFSPFLRPFTVENFRAEPAPAEHPSDWLAVTLRIVTPSYNPKTRTTSHDTVYRHYWISDSGEAVTQDTSESGKELSSVRGLGRPNIPFVVYDGNESLMAEACSYQITALNMISVDSNYAVDSNFAFMVKKQSRSMPTHLDEEKEAQVGRGKGLLYEDQPPAFISPPTSPMQISLALRKEMKEEVREIITGILMSAGDDGTLEAGLAFYGDRLAQGEDRIWDHWTSYGATPSITVSFPDTWSMKTDAERIEEANAWVDLMNKLPGQLGRRYAGKEAYDRAFRGTLNRKELDAVKAQVDEVPYTTADPDVVIKAKEQDIVSVETAAQALGFNPGEGDAAAKDADERAKRAAESMADANRGAQQGLKDLSADPNSVKKVRQNEEKRGEGRFNEGENE
jgi:hypothetical protein